MFDVVMFVGLGFSVGDGCSRETEENPFLGRCSIHFWKILIDMLQVPLKPYA